MKSDAISALIASLFAFASTGMLSGGAFAQQAEKVGRLPFRHPVIRRCRRSSAWRGDAALVLVHQCQENLQRAAGGSGLRDGVLGDRARSAPQLPRRAATSGSPTSSLGGAREGARSVRKHSVNAIGSRR